MSGHSKWATIKHKKAATDAKRGKIFTTIIKEITIAAREGGGDPESNPRLRQAIANAKSANMPSDNITRAIKKGTGELPGVNYEETIYEGYGPAGVAIMMACLTDNKKRTVANIRHLITKYGGNLGENGSVSWMFDKKGQITLKANSVDEEKVFEDALEVGAEDFEVDGDFIIISTDPSDIMSVLDALEEKGYEVESANIDMVPKNLQNVDSDKEQSVITLLEALEDHDDIKAVFTNFDTEN
ncbi:MAG TPA: YebC/PmpR family DNA-binding transcriptional regulator [Candidatus Marinimicrobia bacterium]|mgnify:FL=1|jgi:YebC/PmpR family DNA-binding regulatory protein|nr:MAG: YebC/PmpR family DNA-binding transcriptional regulator [Candidatus Neomarinimicrobiota bacterium]HIA90730.1 YebC/PmpR family DNA-binding transcriptional regulator [Candidatus Neomarinimicrobiota bacterium]HIB60459.1 YebC/PmpR family DNA-binding transcriptional regulator [Candidatus Neomarinimicrobiota bacterium]